MVLGAQLASGYHLEYLQLTKPSNITILSKHNIVINDNEDGCCVNNKINVVCIFH